MRSYFLTGTIALLLGISIGVYLGWEQFPANYRTSHMCQLAPVYQEQYTVWVARGYREDGDLAKAIERLRPLRVEGVRECDDGREYKIDSIADWVQRLTLQYINRGTRLNDIPDLVALAEAFGRLTPEMESFRQVETTP